MRQNIIKISSKGKSYFNSKWADMSLKDALKTLVEYAKKLEEERIKNEQSYKSARN